MLARFMIFVTKQEMYTCSVQRTGLNMPARFQKDTPIVPARLDTASRDAKALSDLGASKGGHARAKSLSSNKLSKIAKKAANARWAKKEREN